MWNWVAPHFALLMLWNYGIQEQSTTGWQEPQSTVVRARPILHDQFIKDWCNICTRNDSLKFVNKLLKQGLTYYCFQWSAVKTSDCREQISTAENSWTGAVAKELLGISWSSPCVTWACCYFRWIKRNFNHLCDTFERCLGGNIWHYHKLAGTSSQSRSVPCSE